MGQFILYPLYAKQPVRLCIEQKQCTISYCRPPLIMDFKRFEAPDQYLQ